MKKNLLLITIISFLFSGCKDNDYATLSYKGKVDSDYIEALVQGRESACFNEVSGIMLRLNSAGEYEEYPPYTIIDGSVLPEKILIIDGRCWVYFCFPQRTETENILAEAWWIYCKETGFTKEIYLTKKVEYNAEYRQLTILNMYSRSDVVVTVEKAEGSLLNLSCEIRKYDSETNSESGCFEISCYEKASLEIPDSETTLVYDSRQDIELDMIAMMREYFGDSFNFSDYLHYYTGTISFEKLEAAIRNHTVYTFDE